jgi:hypothetical protein
VTYRQLGRESAPGSPLNLRQRLEVQERALEHAEQSELFEDRVARAFLVYHTAKPWVADRIEAMAVEYERAGHRRSIGFFFEILRHEVFMESRDLDGFKLNNNFRSRYVRLLEQRRPELLGYFRKRRLHARAS